MDLSESVEMYLVSILRLRSAAQEPVSLSQLAQEFQISSVSVNEMCRKLQEQSLVVYVPYKGVTLTEDGEARACVILRRRRLWVTFLMQHLHLDVSRARQVADQLEHDTPEDVSDRLAEFLDFPLHTPLGNPIPQKAAADSVAKRLQISLADCQAGCSGMIAAVDLPAAILPFLESQNVRTGSTLKIMASSQDGQKMLRVNDEQILSLDTEISSGIQIWSQTDKTGVAVVTSMAGVPDTGTVKATHKPLNELHPGEEGIIVQNKNKGALRKRLLDMGVVPGETIRLQRKAPLGDPMEYEIKTYKLSLRNSEAARITVEISSQN